MIAKKLAHSIAAGPTGDFSDNSYQTLTILTTMSHCIHILTTRSTPRQPDRIFLPQPRNP